ncbi:MAG: HEAT repeat domain-containing protein [Gemmatimonadetes bacterium]|jgi:hypothetical protein|nr:HEAT repeat domain-containing protein [Gemmatimonadota bacterium]MBT6144313.1 HEAT repeat domain-containing protein [Gemmatimonadota bacterium]MBT7864537.1 HEAT repeat domain-containing protein [Gemmatimonadota bacterium]
MMQTLRIPRRHRRLLLTSLALLLVTFLSGCGLRTVIPVRYVPILGAKPKTSTTQVLVRALRDGDVTLRAEAVELLGLLATGPDKGTRQGVAIVLGSALKDSDPGLRLQVVEVLGQMDSELANKYLITALRDPNPFVRGKVLQVLEQRERTRLAPPPSTQQAAQTGG